MALRIKSVVNPIKKKNQEQTNCTLGLHTSIRMEQLVIVRVKNSYGISSIFQAFEDGRFMGFIWHGNGIAASRYPALSFDLGVLLA